MHTGTGLLRRAVRRVRPAAPPADALAELGRERLQAAGARRDAIFVQQGITFDAGGPDGPTRDRPFPLDLIPRVLGGDEWRVIKRGLAQRVRALNLFVEDVYNGVCQDFVHLALILLRDHGVAARYVSGYLFAAPADGGEDSVEVDTHAWIEALLPGDEPTGVGADPTNRKLAGDEHVKIGHGRFYGDVGPPIRGVYKGAAATSEHEVNVRMTCFTK